MGLAQYKISNKMYKPVQAPNNTFYYIFDPPPSFAYQTHSISIWILHFIIKLSRKFEQNSQHS